MSVAPGVSELEIFTCRRLTVGGSGSGAGGAGMGIYPRTPCRRQGRPEARPHSRTDGDAYAWRDRCKMEGGNATVLGCVSTVELHTAALVLSCEDGQLRIAHGLAERLTYVCVHVCMYACACVVCVCMYVPCTYVRTYVRTYVCMYVCMPTGSLSGLPQSLS